MDALECIITRRSIRKYKMGDIPESDIVKLLTVGANAPSAGNQQPWHFIVVTDRERLTNLAETLPYGKMVAHAACLIAVCTDGSELKYEGLAVDDCSAATQNILLAAHAMGYGGVWIGVHHNAPLESELKSSLSMPSGSRIYTMIALGIPDEVQHARANFRQEMVHKNIW